MADATPTPWMEPGAPPTPAGHYTADGVGALARCYAAFEREEVEEKPKKSDKKDSKKAPDCAV